MQKRYVHAFSTDATRTNATNNGVWRNQGLPVFEKKTMTNSRLCTIVQDKTWNMQNALDASMRASNAYIRTASPHAFSSMM